MKKIRIFIADDHALLRRGLTTLLGCQGDFAVVGEATNGEEAVSKVTKARPDVVIMDLSMPVMDGVTATREIHSRVPDTKIVILTTFGTSVDVSLALEAGASGALAKDTDDDVLVDAIRRIANGETVLSPEIKAMLRQEPHPPRLSPRQHEILSEAVKGLSSDAIAAKLGISKDAVDQHIDAVRRKLGAANRVEAVAIALRKHLLKI